MKMLKFLFLAPLMLSLTIGFSQDSTQAESNRKFLSAIPGNTKMVLSGVGWFGFQAHINNSDNSIPKTTFNDFGFSPMFLWKLSNKFFLESEIEIKNDGTADNSAAFDLEIVKMSYSLNKYITFGAGKMLTPFGAYSERWEPVHVEKFPNSPLLPDDGVLPDDTHLFWGAIMGIDVRGCFPMGRTKLNYALYVANGPKLHTENEMAGLLQYENWNDNNSNKEVGGRIGFLPFGNSSLEIGVSGKYGIASDAGDTLHKKIKAPAYAVDLSYVKSIDALKSTISIRGQFTSVNVSSANYNLTDSTTYTFDNTMLSYFAQFSIRPSMVRSKFVKKIELMFRYGGVNPPKEAAWSPKDENGQGGNVTRMDIGLCYWLTWRTGLRFAYEVETLPGGVKDKEFIARLATSL